MKRKIKLDPFEKEIESHIDEFVPITGEKRRSIEAILERSRKTKNINIRISEPDLTRLKKKAEERVCPTKPSFRACSTNTLLSDLLTRRKHLSRFSSWQNTKALVSPNKIISQ